MKYACFGYIDENNFAKVQEGEMNNMVDECFAYDDVLRQGGHFAAGNGLSSASNSTVISLKGGKVAVTDGPFTETKEQIGGILILEAKDLNEAIRLISKHPGVKMGPWEIRPIVDLTPMIQASEERRRKAGRP